MIIDRKKLTRLRQHSGRSIRQLAREAQVSHSHLAYIENGTRNPKEAILKRVTDVLGVPMEDLISG